MLPENIAASSLLSVFETTREERQSFVESIISEIMEGNKNPLEVHLQVKMIEELIKELTSRSDYRGELLEEAYKQGGKSFTFHNAKMEIREVGTKYSYDNCNDPKLIELEQQAKSISDALKARQELLKKLPAEGMEYIDNGSGEVATIYPPSKSSTTSVVVTLR